MANLIDKFEQDCRDAGVRPVSAIKAAGLNSSTWFRWKSGAVSPTLRSLEAAQAGLDLLRHDNDNLPQVEARA